MFISFSGGARGGGEVVPPLQFTPPRNFVSSILSLSLFRAKFLERWFCLIIIKNILIYEYIIYCSAGKDHNKEWLVSEKEKFDSYDKDKDGLLGQDEILNWIVPSNE